MGNNLSTCSKAECMKFFGFNQSNLLEPPMKESEFEKSQSQNIKNSKVLKVVKASTIHSKLLHKCSNKQKQTLSLHKKPPMRHKMTGMVYQGDWNGQIPEGVGTVYFEMGEYYNGQIFQAMAHGFGLFVMINGYSYQGNFHQNKAQGRGVFKNQQGNVIFEGQWKDSKPVKGQYKLQNGIIVKLEKQNYGTIVMQNLDQYIGYINQLCVPHGLGKMNLKIGNSYDGEWVNGQFDGKGVFKWKNLSEYNGQYKKGQKHGYGEYTFPYQLGNPIRKYEGGWENGLQHGQGKLIENGKVVYQGTFQKGKIKSQSVIIRNLKDIHVQIEDPSSNNQSNITSS